MVLYVRHSAEVVCKHDVHALHMCNVHLQVPLEPGAACPEHGVTWHHMQSVHGTE